MNERNIFQPAQANNSFYPYYQPVTQPIQRQEPIPYMMPQPQPMPIIKGRPVSSLEEARVAQIDLDGSLFIFPNLGNKKIYTKRINSDGTATLNSYSLDSMPVEEETTYATKAEVEEIKGTLSEILETLKAKNNSNNQKITF